MTKNPSDLTSKFIDRFTDVYDPDGAKKAFDELERQISALGVYSHKYDYSIIENADELGLGDTIRHLQIQSHAYQIHERQNDGYFNVRVANTGLTASGASSEWVTDSQLVTALIGAISQFKASLEQERAWREKVHNAFRLR